MTTKKITPEEEETSLLHPASPTASAATISASADTISLSAHSLIVSANPIRIFLYTPPSFAAKESLRKAIARFLLHRKP